MYCIYINLDDSESENGLKTTYSATLICHSQMTPELQTLF